jgi:F-type H+-transporting ATPase subunit gamma
MATEKQIAMQITSTKNIRKITASMKMVSAAKLKGDEKRMKLARPFNAWTSAIVGEAKLIEDATFEDLPQRTLLVPFTSEKGLCGGINSYISRSIKACVTALTEQGKECDIVVIGEKGRSQMRRLFSDKIVRSATELIAPGSFVLSSNLANEVMTAYKEKEYDAIVLVSNQYVNPATYVQKYQVIAELPQEGEIGEPLMEYQFEDKKEVMSDMFEYSLASQIYYAHMDGAAAEQAARMAAMENATKNAGDMIASLTLKYNRARQTRITTELIEIISGASALEDK